MKKRSRTTLTNEKVTLNKILRVQSVKIALWNQIKSTEIIKESYLEKVESELRNKLNAAFRHKVSTSLLLIGPQGSCKKN